MFYPSTQMNVDISEVEKFSARAQKWWDVNGEFKTLHDINPIRLAFMKQYARIRYSRIVDIGCGGGILAESLAAEGAKVTGIDLAAPSIEVARRHLLEKTVSQHAFESKEQIENHIDYQLKTAETLSAEMPGSFDIVSCMEMLEHVPAPESIVRACAQLAKPGGWIFFSTLSRTPKSYLLAIIGAEYLLNLLPRGTHQYKWLIKPAELSRMIRAAGLESIGLTGIKYNPLTRQASFHPDTSVNYLICCKKH